MKFKNVKWIFFDLGSTLIDETVAYQYRVKECIEGSSVTYKEFDDKRIEFSKNLVCGDKEAAEYFNLSLKPWRNDVEYPYKDAEMVVKSLKEKGYGLIVVANQAFGTKERLNNWGLLKYFDAVFSSAEEGVSKPDKEIFLRAINFTCCKAENCVMIGDRLDNDILPAKELRIKTILVKQGVVAPYQEVPSSKYQPDYIVYNLKEILNIF